MIAFYYLLLWVGKYIPQNERATTPNKLRNSKWGDITFFNKDNHGNLRLCLQRNAPGDQIAALPTEQP